MTQQDVDQLYREWRDAANTVGNTRVEREHLNTLWNRFAVADDEVNGKLPKTR